MRFAREADGGRSATLVAALGTLVAGFAVSAAPGRPWSIAFLLIAPAIPAAVLWRAVDPWGRLALSGAAALIIDAVVAEVMLAAGAWSLRGGIVAVTIVSALMWVSNTLAWNAMARSRVPSAHGAGAERERGESRSS
jgi:hypothetical protein